MTPACSIKYLFRYLTAIPFQKYTALLLGFVVYTQAFPQGDICDGNIGDNIFESGDFGNGSLNIPDLPENIITTYNYVRFGPPSDGNFTITNNTGEWSNLYPTWMELGDNSEDPNGYFMVFNADYTAGIFYEEIINDLCENTLYVFSADIINVIKTGTQNHILPNVSFLLDEEEQYSTGNLPQNEKWITYGFTFTTGPGVTSMKLSLRNNAPGGIGNDLAIDNITFRPCGPKAEILPYDVANICEDGEPITIESTLTGNQYASPFFQWQQSFDEGFSWENIENAKSSTYSHTEKSAGFYHYRYLLANSEENLNNAKCRVNSNTKIIQVVPKFYAFSVDICEGLSYETGSSSYTRSGIYVDSLISSIGCDSIVTLDLSVIPDVGITADITAEDPRCFGGGDGHIQVTKVQNPILPYTIRIDNQIRDEETIFEDLSSGSYDILIEDAIGCYFRSTVFLSNPSPFEIELGDFRTINLGEEISLKPESTYPITQFNWSPNVSECTTNCAHQAFYPSISQFYKLQAVNEAGCVAEDSVFIEVIPIRQVFFPNVFSPNFDGINDFFSVYARIPNVKEIIQIAIYDRWGNRIFSRQNLQPAAGINLWDGTYQGKIMDTGVYIFHARIAFMDDTEEEINGDFTLIR